ncbi:hypothetical protein KSS87_022883 [Heliosperma pusillum]|nr:hypothetical protein KSS87_022883 [Heliosperma pusillum]
MRPVIGRYPSSDGSQLGGIIKKDRKCKDVVFLIIFVAFWVGMIVNSSFGFSQGNPLRLTYGLDYKGNLCGDRHANPDLRELELRYWMNPNQVYESGLKKSSFKLDDARSICLLDCPFPAEDSLSWVCDYPDGDIHLTVDEWIDRNYDYFEFLSPDMRNTSLQLQGPCYPVIYPSVNAIHGGHWEIVAGIDSLWSTRATFFVGDLVAFDSTFCLWDAMDNSPGWMENDAVTPIVGEHDPYTHVYGRELTHMRVAATVMTVVMGISLLASIAIVRRILMATSVAAKVIGEVQALMIFPVIPFTILAIFYMIWLSAAFHLFSSGEVRQNNCNSNCCAYDLVSKRVSCERCCGYSIHYTPHIGIAILFHLLGGYWATHFFIASSSTVIAGSVASYYWARGDASPDIPFLPVFGSMKRLLRYNIGSVAIGSLLLSFVESIRFILESIRRKLKVSYITPDNWFRKIVYHSSNFCLKSVEWTLKSVNRNAYIMIAITGKSFFKSSAIATGLIMNNILRIGKVNVIGDVILSLGKLCVSLSSALFGFLMLDSYKYKSAHNKISSPLFPVLACWALGYIVATLFFGVVEMSIDTIILSFCQDAEEHQGTAQYAPPLLIETLNDENDTQRLTQ